MGGRRQFGRIRKLPSGRHQARYHGIDGQDHPAPETFATKTDAAQWLAAAQVDQLRGVWIDPRAGRLTLTEWSERWLADRRLRPRTAELYRHLLRLYILPSLGRTELSRLSPSTIRGWHARLAEAHPSTAAKAYRLLRTTMNTAVADELIARNPCRVNGAGVEHAPERPIPTVAEVAALCDAMPDRWRLLVLLAAWCGLRRGELLALQRQNFDGLRRSVGVERTHQYMCDGRILQGPPKTEAGRRLVTIPPHLADDVADHLARFVGPEPEALVFAGVKGGMLRPHVLQKHWNRARASVGLDHLHLHDLRHLGATLTAASGATTKELMARLGHATPAAALRYQHATEDRDRAIAEALSGLAKSAPVIPLVPANRPKAKSDRARIGHAGRQGS